MKYLCVNCNYIYDEAIWDNVDSIEAWTKIEDIETCPSCYEYDTFSHITEEITYLDSEFFFDSIEQEHDIEIEKIDNNLSITIWWNSHPMWDDHRIAWVWLFDEYWDLVEENFLSENDDTIVIFEDYDLDEFEIRVKCTQHKIFAKKFVL